MLPYRFSPSLILFHPQSDGKMPGHERQLKPIKNDSLQSICKSLPSRIACISYIVVEQQCCSGFYILSRVAFQE